MKSLQRALILASALSVLGLALFGGVGSAASTSQTRLCPLPVVGGDADRVELAGPTAPPVAGQVSYTVTADESVGEAKHTVYLAVSVSSADGGTSSASPNGGVSSGTSPTVVTLSLQQGHRYSVAWVAAFDFGVHMCSSAQPDQSPFQVNTGP